MILILLLSVVCGTLIMLAVYALPVGPMRRHVSQSIELILDEGNYPSWADPYHVYTQSDGFADAVMLEEAIYDGGGPDTTLVQRTMWNIRTSTAHGTPIDGLAAMLSDSGEELFYGIYARYWHGYLVFLKPLLMITNLTGIRIVNGICQFLLFITLLVRVRKSYGIRQAFALFCAFFCLMPVTTALCLEYSHAYYVCLLSIHAMISWHRRSAPFSSEYLFLVIGIVLAFGDFLTFPVVTLGLPLIFYLTVIRTQTPWRMQLRDIVTCSASWGAGYAGMWSAKWLICYLLTGFNALSDAMHTVQYRMTGDLGDGSRPNLLACLTSTLGVYKRWPFFLLAGVFLVFCTVLLIRKKAVFSFPGKRLIPLSVVLFYPVAWSVFALNHTQVHLRFTHRIWAVSAYAAIEIVFLSLPAVREYTGTPPGDS